VKVLHGPHSKRFRIPVQIKVANVSATQIAGDSNPSEQEVEDAYAGHLVDEFAREMMVLIV